MIKKTIAEWFRKIAMKLDPKEATFYQVFHDYDADGGFGDAIPQSKELVCFESEDDAKTFVNRFEKPHVYDIPYAELACGYLRVEKIEAISHEKFDVDKIDTSQFWWLQDRFSGSYWRLSSAEDEMEEKEDDL